MALWNLLFLFVHVVIAFDPYNDDDLNSYLTLPRHRILKWDITYHDRSRVAPGYWFVAPYFKYGGEEFTNRWMPCQVGPYIFDQDGELVWAGACDYPNRNAYDFRVVNTLGPSPHLSWQMHPPFEGSPEDGLAVIYNNHYEPIYQINRPTEIQDMHEFMVKEPPVALTLIARNEWRSMAEFGQDRNVWAYSVGFAQLDIETGLYRSQWFPDEIQLMESFVLDPREPDPARDWLHGNSIDTDSDGNFLFSARHLDTIYLIDRQFQFIIWRLGGLLSDFEMDFEFHRQHDAKFISSNSTHVVLSFLNNGADNHGAIESTSAGMYVELNLMTLKARLLNRYPRPDKGISFARGNMQTLPNNNVLMSWSAAAYMSEFAHDGTLLMEARFASNRLDTYRAYKFPWVGRPKWPPDLVAFCYGVNGSESTTAFHVSWNGATGISYWRFYSWNGNVSTEIGTIPKKGFETTYIARGYMEWVSAEALGSEYESMGNSTVHHTNPPAYWPEGAPKLKADDPSSMKVSDAAKAARFARLTAAMNARAGLLVESFIAGFLISAAICILFFKASTYRYSQCLAIKYLWSKDSVEEEEELNLLRDTERNS
ncbi:hypothetical protein N7495_004044 [Penicillium taxi]|uniref:uncharacterized protein n=1 Tax=Penicillium taxi TaxID=168475 RepID=UPI002544E222|nr:uncharacterized protein N7495_004044 [Penicillium taxi]KAJ5899300.1 hypothetical protein N7495_004044 [Penicillium taxi]